MRRQHWTHCPWVILVLLLALVPCAHATDWEHWYVVELAGQQAGWMMERQTTLEGRITSQNESELRINRGGTELVLTMSSQFVETVAGEPISMRTEQRFGQQPMVLEATFSDDSIVEKTTQGEAVHERSIPTSQESWLTPAAAQRRLAEVLRTGANQLSYRTLDPLAGLTPIEVDGARLQELPNGATRWRLRTSLLPGQEEIVDLDAMGTTLASTTSLMGMELTYRLSDRSSAQTRDSTAPELLVSSLIHPDRSIARPRRLRHAVYQLSLAEGTLPELPSGGAQRAEHAANGAVRVHVSVGRPTVAPETPTVPSPQIDRQFLLRATPYLDFESEAVQAVRAGTPFPETATTAQRAELLRGQVHRFMTRKDLATGFATASEAATARAGDCTEHAVLLTALLRADGIPARVVSGLLYVDQFASQRQVFGYHLWSQGWIDGHWRDLDAMTAEPFDATHIALATSPLDSQEDFVAISASLLPLMGALRVEVVELQHEKEKIAP